ncbi:MAG: 23S rRNA (uracil(1939)-C(5))-methyltransferase RlmD [Desulfobacteraceae bacterium]|nr:23S rRNA (uracil(1939)-C(5))-methyltransferase RlmD [Desulfobacteraceae bacterium]
MKTENKNRTQEKRSRISTDKAAPVVATQEQHKPRLLRNMIVELTITAIDEDGYGTARVDGLSYKIGGALPGDVIRAKIDHVSFGAVTGHLYKLLKFSPLRSKRPPCSVGAECLGCPLIAMRYTDQKVWKRGMILNELAKYPALAAVTVHPLLSPDRLIHYRNSAKLVVAGKHSEPVLGIYRRASHDVFDLEACPIHHPLINRVMEVVRRGITKLKVPIFNPRSKMGLLRYLVVRVSESEQKAMVVLITADKSYNEIHHLSKFVREALPEVEVIASNVNSSDGNVIFGQKDTFLTPKHYLTERLGDMYVQISPRSFFQVNTAGARLIYEKVREWAALDKNSTVLDLYCGIGGIGLFLADQAKKVIGIEVVEEAVADARKNARLNGFKNCRFEAGDAADLLEELADDGEQVDVVVLNPPRKGCDEAVLQRVAGLSPLKILYVSCSPESLMRDLDILLKLGYACQEIQPVDMFPQTVHVENVARLEKNDKSA